VLDEIVDGMSKRHAEASRPLISPERPLLALLLEIFCSVRASIC
jgi:hypothetical protein